MSTPNERDRSIERLLQESFRKPEAGVTDACLDAETLAAFSDGGLTGEALEFAQTHLADCARCQAIVGAAARVRTIAHDPEPAGAGRGWLAWAIPLTAGAAALAIWVAVPRPATTPALEQQARQEAPQAKVAEPAPTPLQVPPAPGVTEPQQSAARKNDQPARDAAPAAALQKDSDLKEMDRLQRETRSDRGVLPDQAAAAPAAPAAPPARREAFAPQAANSAEKLSASPGTSQAATAGATRWRIAANALERSQDGGTTWTAVALGINAPLTALSAPSPTVCWVVGRAGVVLRTTDAQTFSRVPFPEMTDLAGVQARDGQAATITTVDGRNFSTADGGAAWQRQQ